MHVPGSATGTRELGVLAPGHLAGRIHGLCLSGGSAFGLGAADGVLAVLEKRGVGFPVGHTVVPIVPAAILFDLAVAQARPDAAMGAAAAEAASSAPLAEGRVGAGTGATVANVTGAPQPGGIGCWSEVVDRYTVGAVAAVNALGAVWDPADAAWLTAPPPAAPAGPVELRAQTTLVAVVTDAPLAHDGCAVMARMASAGFARTLFPAFSPFDGDVVFVAATGDGTGVSPQALMGLGDAAARVVATAIVRGVQQAALAQSMQQEPSGGS